MEEWKIERRKPRCTPCGREFAPEAEHYSAILESEARFERRDVCLSCWGEKPLPAFSYWKTRTPRREDRPLENVDAMVEFMKRLLASPSEEPLRRKVTYLIALILLRKRRLKAVGRRDGVLRLEKSWDGEVVEVAEPWIAEEELEPLRLEMEQLFVTET